jgi:hypothetical protein
MSVNWSRVPRLFVLGIFAAFLAGAAFASSGDNALPYIDAPLVPTSVKPGSAGFTITVNGAGFAPGSVVNWNGSPRVTTFVSKAQLTASILATDITVNRTVSITVSSPTPGGGISNVIFFPVTNQTPAVGLGVEGTCSGNPAAVADFNLDGKPDIASLIVPSNMVSILLGRGDGTFRTKASYGTENDPLAAATGDFNSDGKPDLIVASGNRLTILLGKGDGTFQPATALETGEPLAVAAGDFNEDGALDLVVSNFRGSTLSIFLGNGDGTFQPPMFIHLGQIPGPVVIGDFNGDGHLDIAVGAHLYGFIYVFLGNGDGTFGSPTTTSVQAGRPSGFAAADFNGDGKLDLAVATATTSVSVFLGNGDGSFGSPHPYNVPAESFALATGDLFGRGSLDLAVEQLGGSGVDNTLSILQGQGDGSFKLLSSFPSSGGPSYLVEGDFNGDGKLDLDDGCVFLQVPRAVALTPPSSLTFATQVVGSASPAKQVKLTSVGEQATTISNIATSGDFAQTNNCPASLSANKGCFIDVIFTPTATGTQTGTLTITDDAAGSPQTLSLTGTGTIVTFGPSSLNFGNQALGTSSSPQPVTLSNLSGTTTLNIASITITGPAHSNFAQTNNCGSTLSPGANCTINVTFTPSAKGSRQARMSINDDGGGLQNVSLSGAGT